MHYLLAALLFWILKITGAALEDTNVTHFRCGTEAPRAALVEVPLSTGSSPSNAATTVVHADIEINLYFHVVFSTGKEGTVTEQMLADQVRSPFKNFLRI